MVENNNVKFMLQIISRTESAIDTTALVVVGLS